MKTPLIAPLAAAFALVATSAQANTTLTFPSPSAACIAQAWVPLNTDPTVTQPLGQWLSTTGYAQGGGLRQNDCKR